MSTERTAYFTYGPRFFKEGSETMFEFAIDHANKFGPMRATDAHMKKHAAAWAEFEKNHPRRKQINLRAAD